MINTLKNLTIRKYWRLKILWDYKKSFLHDSGWIQSYQQKRIIDRNGNDIPWISNSAFKFLDNQKLAKLHVYEYGAGASTDYFSRKDAIISSVENDKKWYDQISQKDLENVQISFAAVGDGYVESIDLTKSKYDIIFIDGRLRVKCFQQSLSYLEDHGIIILDDTHREKYSAVYDIAKQQNFKWIDFWGFANGSLDYKCTTVFYRTNNVFEI